MKQISQTSGDFGFKPSTYGMLTTTQVLQNVINTSLRRTRQTDRMPQRMVLVHDEDIAKEVSYVIKYEYLHVVCNKVTCSRTIISHLRSSCESTFA